MEMGLGSVGTGLILVSLLKADKHLQYADPVLKGVKW